MSRWLIGMSGDKDKMIEHLLKCEKRMLKQFEEIRTIALKAHPSKFCEEIVLLCDVYLDKRSDTQKMQDEIDELKEQIKQIKGEE